MIAARVVATAGAGSHELTSNATMIRVPRPEQLGRTVAWAADLRCALHTPTVRASLTR